MNDWMTGDQEGHRSDQDGAKDDEEAENDEQCAFEVAECRVTSSRHDDWLHRGPFLADLPWQVYMMRVQRVRKPTQAGADYTELFFFDKHYALSALYCQEIRYAATVAVPRVIGSTCPAESEAEKESHAAYKLMLFARTRCPGPAACADPMMFRSLLLPSDKPDEPANPQTTSTALLAASLGELARASWR